MVGRTWKWLWERRRRVAPLVLVLGALVIGGQLLGAVRHETDVRYRLGPEHAEFTSVLVSYRGEADGLEAAGARFRWDDGAPESIRHQVDLPPGRYTIRVELAGPGRSRSIRRTLEIPADGLVTLDVFQPAERAGSPASPAGSVRPSWADARAVLDQAIARRAP